MYTDDLNVKLGRFLNSMLSRYKKNYFIHISRILLKILKNTKQSIVIFFVLSSFLKTRITYAGFNSNRNLLVSINLPNL